MDYPYYSRNTDDINITTEQQVDIVDHPSGYIAGQGLVDAVNVALLLNKPLLLTGEPGTGKTQLAYSVAWQLSNRNLLNITSSRVEKFETKSLSVARDLLYTFDTLRRFHAAQSDGSTNNVDYITYNALGKSIINALPYDRVKNYLTHGFNHNGPTRSIVLIDEIDKAPRDFPNDLLNELEQMYFKVPELGNVQIGGPDQLADEYKPILIITSNSERNLPDPFLRRCIYYDIPFPTEDELNTIIFSRLPRIGSYKNQFIIEATELFIQLRREGIARRKISAAELIQWVDFMLQRGADVRKPLKASSEFVFEGLSALTKDPIDQSQVKAQMEIFLSER